MADYSFCGNELVKIIFPHFKKIVPNLGDLLINEKVCRIISEINSLFCKICNKFEKKWKNIVLSKDQFVTPKKTLGKIIFMVKPVLLVLSKETKKLMNNQWIILKIKKVSNVWRVLLQTWNSCKKFGTHRKFEQFLLRTGKLFIFIQKQRIFAI